MLHNSLYSNFELVLGEYTEQSTFAEGLFCFTFDFFSFKYSPGLTEGFGKIAWPTCDQLLFSPSSLIGTFVLVRITVDPEPIPGALRVIQPDQSITKHVPNI